MGKLSIKVVLAGRTYPLTINEGEEEKVRAAVESINRNIKMLQDNYAVKDMQDLLAMTALQLATKEGASLQKNDVATPSYKAVEEELQRLSSLISAE
jgi:cell division protein ZapA